MTKKTIYLKDYQPADFHIHRIHLHFELDEDVTAVQSILKMSRHSQGNPTAQIKLDGEKLDLKKVLLNGKELNQNEYETDLESLTLLVDVPEGEFTVETHVLIKPQENTQLAGLYKSGGNFCTQCEPHGFRRITYSLDRPDVMSRFTTTISADKNVYPMLLSNGNLMDSKELEDNRQWVHWEDPSLKPAYLFALVAGDFDLISDTFQTMSGKRVDLHLYLEKGFKSQGNYAIEALKKAMKWDEENYGREYDLAIYMIVAVSDFNMGAMENKGLNIFNTKYILADADTATDMDYVLIDDVVGHEYFHNWTGNRITCRDWFQLTLKEGLTVFRDQTFTEDMTTEGVARIDSANVVRTRQFAEDAGPMAHPIRPDSYIEINNFYTETVYRKGSEVIRMIRTLSGKENFRKGMDLYFKRHDGQAVTTDDFVAAMADAANRDLTQFKRWYDQAGTPELFISSDYDAANKTLKITVKQTCPPTPFQKEKKPFHLPLSLGLLNKKGEVLLATQVLEITKPEEAFIFNEINEKPILSLLRGFSAPVKIHYDYSDEDLLLLWQCDTDPFARWEAGQVFMTRFISGPERQPALLNAFKKILTTKEKDKRLQARLLILPSENYLMQQLPDMDIEKVHAARVKIKNQLAVELTAEWEKIYRDNQTDAYDFNMQDMGKRRLKNTCLDYLATTGEKKYLTLAYEQAKYADNMTDRMGALMALNDVDCDERDMALTEFYERFQHQPLVVNKWLSLHSSSSLPDTLDKVKFYFQHRAFDLRNPNKVYALLGAFGENIPCFHAKNGEGYRFLAEQILKIDPINPQVAARMLQPLTRWKQVDSHRQDLMKASLQTIMQAPNLSKDVFEITEKSLL